MTAGPVPVAALMHRPQKDGNVDSFFTKNSKWLTNIDVKDARRKSPATRNGALPGMGAATRRNLAPAIDKLEEN